MIDDLDLYCPDSTYINDMCSRLERFLSHGYYPSSKALPFDQLSEAAWIKWKEDFERLDDYFQYYVICHTVESIVNGKFLVLGYSPSLVFSWENFNRHRNSINVLDFVFDRYKEFQSLYGQVQILNV